MGNLAHKANFDSIWFFGTCFTHGFGCRPPFEYYKKYKKEGDYRWTEIVCKHFTTRGEMKATPAKGTNFETIRVLSQELLNIKPSDIVVIEQAPPHGILKLSEDGSRVENLATWNMEWDKHWIDDKDKEVGVGYWKHYIVGKEEAWMNYFHQQIQVLRGILLSRGIKSVLWYSDWYENAGRFERIKEHTDGKIDDYHFSWQGHRDVGQHIIDKIENNEFFKRTLV
jgi:hypothetical protein